MTNSSVLEYRLFAANKYFNAELAANLKSGREDPINWQWRAELEPHERSAVDYVWMEEHPPLLVRAMTLANRTLFIAGPPDVVDEKQAWGRFLYPEVRGKLDNQVTAWAGDQGGLLCTVSAEDGEMLATYTLSAPPIFDGMIAANNSLYLVLNSGDIVCYGANATVH